MFSKWSQALAQLMESGRAGVLVTQISDRGSSPRSRGSKMLVTLDGTIESLGGGHLEFEAINYARELIDAGRDGVFERSYSLGSELGQCCGGEVRLLFEVFNSQVIQLYLFGAGHVAQALVPLLAGLGFNVHWTDDRDELFVAPIPAGVERLERDPVDVAATLPAGAWAVIMTHDHQLDFELVIAALESPASYLGMIGSATKARRFLQRLEQRDITPAQRERLITPLGLAHLKTKTPLEIAVSVAADLMHRRQLALSAQEPMCA